MAGRDDKRILHLIRTELIPRSQDPTQKMTRAACRRRLQRGWTYVWLSKYGTCIGFIHLIKVKDTLWIDLLAVVPRRRGKGIGTALLQRALESGRKSSVATVRLFVDSNNQAAIRFYEKAGFATVRYVVQANCYEMELPLTEKDDERVSS